MIEKLRRFWLGHGRFARLLVAGQRRALPGAQEVELPEFLAQPHRLVAHALLLVVVAHLDEAGHREVLAQRMALEAIVGQDAAQVRVPVEQHAEKVVGLALVPVGAGKHGQALATGVASSVATLTRIRAVQLRRQQVIDDLEALLALGIVGAADVDDSR